MLAPGVRADHRRDALQQFLKERGIGSEIYYPLPLHLQPCFQHRGHREGDLPASERAGREVLSLPVSPELRTEERTYIIKTLQESFQ